MTCRVRSAVGPDAGVAGRLPGEGAQPRPVRELPADLPGGHRSKLRCLLQVMWIVSRCSPGLTEIVTSPLVRSALIRADVAGARGRQDGSRRE